MKNAQNPTSSSRKGHRQAFASQLIAHGLELEPVATASQTWVVRTHSKPAARTFVRLLCAVSIDANGLWFAADRNIREHMQNAAPWTSQFQVGVHADAHFPDGGFWAIPVPERDTDFWVLDMENKRKRTLFAKALHETSGAAEPGFVIDLNVEVDGVSVKQVLNQGFNAFKEIADYLTVRTKSVESASLPSSPSLEN